MSVSASVCNITSKCVAEVFVFEESERAPIPHECALHPKPPLADLANPTPLHSITATTTTTTTTTTNMKQL